MPTTLRTARWHDALQGQSLVWTGGIALGQTITIQDTVTVKDLDDLGDGKLKNAVTGTGETNCKTYAPPPTASPRTS